MKINLRPPDTIAWRIALTVGSAIIGVLILSKLFNEFAGVWARQIHFKVIDHGPGIPAHALEQVFAPFYRLEQSRNRTTGGMGLGLTSARAVIQGHGGDISLRNREGGGLEVNVILPAVS